MSRHHSRHAKVTSRHQARHAKPAPAGPSALIGTAAKAVPASLVVGAAGSALALTGTTSAIAATTHGAPVSSRPAAPAAAKTAAARPRVTRAQLAAARTSYTVVSGDTLSGISARFCATPADYPSLASASHIANANLIYAGQAITLACHAAVAPAPAAAPAPGPAQAPAPAPAPADAATTVSPVGLSAFESCVISHESGGNPQAVNPSSDAGGLFQFLPSTWAGLGYAAAYPGGAQTAPVGVQEAAFDKLYAEAGTAPWGPYDGC